MLLFCVGHSSPIFDIVIQSIEMTCISNHNKVTKKNANIQHKIETENLKHDALYMHIRA